jgi:hypothetical protein
MTSRPGSKCGGVVEGVLEGAALSTVYKTQECFPQSIDFGVENPFTGLPMVFPAPEPDHAHCAGGHHLEGVLGGWHCP